MFSQCQPTIASQYVGSLQSASAVSGVSGQVGQMASVSKLKLSLAALGQNWLGYYPEKKNDQSNSLRHPSEGTLN